MGSLVLVVPLLAAAAALPESRSFWTVDAGSERQPVQRQVAARLVRTGEHVAFYQEEGYRFAAAGAEAEAAQLDQAVTAFDTLIYPRQVELYGPCPDLDGNGKVIVLLTRSTWAPTFFWRFDQMTEAEAARHGFRSNQGEVLYLAFEQQGNRASANLASHEDAKRAAMLKERADNLAKTAQGLANAASTAQSNVQDLMKKLDDARKQSEANPGDAAHRDAWIKLQDQLALAQKSAADAQAGAEAAAADAQNASDIAAKAEHQARMSQQAAFPEGGGGQFPKSGEMPDGKPAKDGLTVEQAGALVKTAYENVNKSQQGVADATGALHAAHLQVQNAVTDIVVYLGELLLRVSRPKVVAPPAQYRIQPLNELSYAPDLTSAHVGQLMHSAADAPHRLRRRPSLDEVCPRIPPSDISSLSPRKPLR